MKQDQGSIFMLRKHAQSIFRIENPQIVGFPVKIRTFFTFTSILYPESGSRKHFQASGMGAIDFPHKITPKWVISGRKNFGTYALRPPPLPKFGGGAKRISAKNFLPSLINVNWRQPGELAPKVLMPKIKGQISLNYSPFPPLKNSPLVML